MGQRLRRNTSGQSILVFAFTASTAAPLTGGAAQISANIALDDGSASATNDVNPTETQRGHYRFDLSQAETDAASHIDVYPDSSTTGVEVVVVGGSRIPVDQPSITMLDSAIVLPDMDKDTIAHVYFRTANQYGAPSTLGGTPTAAIYREGISTPIITGVTVDTDHNSVTGLNHVTIDTTNAAYQLLSDYHVVLEAGTHDGISEVGRILAYFSIDKYAVRVSSAQIGQEGEDIASVYNIFSLGIPARVGATPTSGADFNIIFDYPPAAGYSDDDLNGRFLVFTSGSMAGLSKVISDFTASGGRVQFLSARTDLKDSPFPRTPTEHDRCVILGLA